MPKVQKVVNGELVDVEVDDEGNDIQDPEVKPELDEDGNPIEPEPELDEDGNPIEPKPEPEPWSKEDEDGVPLSTHVHMKQKLKGRVSERDDKISKLEEEIERLKKGKPKADVVDIPKRPKRDDFESDDDYYAAVDEYEEKRDDIKLKRQLQDKEVKDRQQKALAALNQSVDEHYERANKLVEENKLDPKVYKDNRRL